MASRPSKSIRLSFVKNDPELGAHIQLLGRPAEVRIASSNKVFLSVREEGITLSPGMTNNINLQGMSHNLRYGGLLMDLPFPMSLIPVTPFTPYPKQFFAPPLSKIMPFVSDLSSLLSMLVL